MTKSTHQIVRDFFAAMSGGTLSHDLLTEDVTVWTTTSGGGSDRDRYIGGTRMLQSIFDGGLAYTIDSITAEDDRAIAEVRAHGTLVNGEEYSNRYVFIFHIRGGRISSLAEHFNPDPIAKQIMPLMMVAMEKTGD